VTIARESTVSVAPNPLRWRALSVLALMQFVIVIDNTIVNVALPSIQQHLHFSVGGLAWVVDGYMLAAGGLLLLGGRIGDMVGHRRLFLAGTFVFGLASIASGVSVDAAMLVISRFAQGIGEAMAAPAALALIAGLFTGKERAKALGIWGGLGGLGATVGVLLSGILVQWADWRWIFLINIPFALTALVMVPRFLPDERPERRRERPDVAGAVLVTAGLTLVVDALLHAANHGWGGAGTVVPFVVGIGCLIGFGVVETRAASPLAPPSFFTDRSRVAANGASALMAGAMAGMFLLLTLYQQQVLHYSAIRTGIAYLPFCLAFVPGFGISAAVMSRAGTKAAMVLAFGTCTVGMVLMARISVGGDYVGELLPAMLVLAIGLGMAFPAAQNAALAGTTDETTGLAAGVQTAVQALGAALGVAALVTIAAHGRSTFHGAFAAAIVHGDRLAFWVGAIAYLAAGLIALAFVGRLRHPTV